MLLELWGPSPFLSIDIPLFSSHSFPFAFSLNSVFLNWIFFHYWPTGRLFDFILLICAFYETLIPCIYFICFYILGVLGQKPLYFLRCFFALYEATFSLYMWYHPQRKSASILSWGRSCSDAGVCWPSVGTAVFPGLSASTQSPDPIGFPPVESSVPCLRSSVPSPPVSSLTVLCGDTNASRPGCWLDSPALPKGFPWTQLPCCPLTLDFGTNDWYIFFWGKNRKLWAQLRLSWDSYCFVHLHCCECPSTYSAPTGQSVCFSTEVQSWWSIAQIHPLCFVFKYDFHSVYIPISPVSFLPCIMPVFWPIQWLGF